MKLMRILGGWEGVSNYDTTTKSVILYIQSESFDESCIPYREVQLHGRYSYPNSIAEHHITSTKLMNSIPKYLHHRPHDHQTKPHLHIHPLYRKPHPPRTGNTARTWVTSPQRHIYPAARAGWPCFLAPAGGLVLGGGRGVFLGFPDHCGKAG